MVATAHDAGGVDGTLTLEALEESTGRAAVTRLEISRVDAPNRRVIVRKSVPAGIGVILDRNLDLALPDASYQFRTIRGPEYRIISGTFTLEKTSLDTHRVELPRMIDMRREGWTSGDCCVPASPYSLPLRMASEDLHVSAVLGEMTAKPIPGRDRTETIEHDPSWIRSDVRHEGGLVYYGVASDFADSDLTPVERLVDRSRDSATRVAIENPFAWPLPVWVASQKIDGFFLLGDWLRLDRKVTKVKDGRRPQGPRVGDARSLGRWAERIYWHLLECGLRIPPLAGGGDASANLPVGYNRVYVTSGGEAPSSEEIFARAAVESADQWWQAAWDGHSVVTNGPMLRPLLGGMSPGHLFQATSGEVLRLTPELNLSVRDPVEYLEVIHNGRVHYSARLDEFAKAGGTVPPIETSESGWVTIRVVTLYEDHFRAAMSAPWYIEFDGVPRINDESVEFFRRWLREYEQRLKRLPPEQLRRHVPFIRAAREFWSRRGSQPRTVE